MDRTPAGPGPAADVAATIDPLQAAEQTAVIEAARLYVADIGVIDLTNAATLTGHLMAAEVLLMKIVTAFADPTTTED